MSEQHTHGPWCVLPEEVDKSYIRVRGTRLGDRYKIANVLAVNYDGAPAYEADETRANARLIAQAPDLLDIAQRVEAMLTRQRWLATGDDPESVLLRDARAAIARAEGRL